MSNLKSTVALGALLVAIASGAQAASFVNGDFETGTAAGWTEGTGFRGFSLYNPLNPTDFLPGGPQYNPAISGNTSSNPAAHSAIIDSSYVDPHVSSALLGSTVYSGNYSYRVEDTNTGGYASVISQSVTNYTDSDIFFAWKAVLDGAHGPASSATMQIVLHDDTTNTDLITRTYNAASGGSGVDPRFSYDLSSNDYYTGSWQIEDLTIGAGLSGHNFTLTVLGADCNPTGHWGYVYLDGFGAAAPVEGPAPEPASIALLGAGLAGVAALRRRKKV